jgi:hypothetical protein
MKTSMKRDRGGLVGCGSAAMKSDTGRNASAERGSVLILVVGVLALIATVVIVYTTVGQTDKRSGSGTVRQARADGQVRAIAERLSQVIANGTFKVQAQADLAGNRPVSVRVPMDYPGVDPLAVAVTQSALTAYTNRAGLDQVAFRSSGSLPVSWAYAGTDPRMVSDPWLASSMPERLVVTNPALTAAAARNGDPVDGNQPWRDMRDWRSISNVAPGGLFVNLVNLRNNFKAEPGIGDAAPNKPRMSTGLTLLDPNYEEDATSDRAPEMIPRATLNLARPLARSNASGALGVRTTVPDLRGANAVYRPADFTINQVGMARPVRETRLSTARTSLTRIYDTPPSPDNRIVPGDQEYFSNQYADADGDGWADSRWFEPVDPTLIDASGNFVTRTLLPGGSPWRIFVAARIVDLSSKVNVNTAMQLAGEPTAAHPAGLTPADIDLERLLRMDDLSQPNRTDGVATRWPLYEGLSQPSTPSGVIQFRPGASSGQESAPANYRQGLSYSEVLDLGWNSSDVQRAALVGRSAFAALLDARVRATDGPLELVGNAANLPTALPTSAGFYPPFDEVSPVRGFGRETALGVPSGGGGGTTVPRLVLFRGNQVNAADRAVLFEAVQKDAPLVATSDGASTSQSLRLDGVTNGFRAADELELRTFEGVNDSSVTSRLERVLASRSTEGPNMSPVRGNRPFELERLDRDRVTFASSTFDVSLARLEADQRPDPDPALQAQIDVRRHLTALSGGRQLVASEVTGSEGRLSGRELPVNAEDVLARINAASLAVDGSQPAPNWGAMNSAVQELFRGAADSLLPYSAERASGVQPWRGESDAASPTNPARSLFYGGLRTVPGDPPQPKAEDYRGSPGEVALRLSAHWTANLVASRLQWTRPVPASGGGTADGVEAADLPVMFTLLAHPEQSVTGVGAGTALDVLDSRAPTTVGTPAVSFFPEWNAADEFGTSDAELRPFMPRVAARLQLPVERLPEDINTELWSPAARIFGITPQPFITQMSSLVVYVSVEEDEVSGGVPTGKKLAIISGSTDATAGKSFITEIVTFAIHNPFDVELSLSGVRVASDGRVVNMDDTATVTPGQVRHYIEFGGEKYALAKSDLTSQATLTNITLAPGETKLVFVSDVLPSTMLSRLQAAGVALSFQGELDGWLLGLLGLDDVNQMIRLAPLEDRFDALKPVDTSKRGVLNTDDNLNRVAKLWRVIRTELEPLTTGNSQQNDQLLDRLRDPQDTLSKPTLDRRLPEARRAQIGDADTPDGHLLVRAGRVRRPGTPRPPGDPEVRGALPAYCLEVKSPLTSTGAGLDSRVSGVSSLNEQYESGTTELNDELDRGRNNVPIQETTFLTPEAYFTALDAQVKISTPTNVGDRLPEPWNFSESPSSYPSGGTITNLSGLSWRVNDPRGTDPVTSTARLAWTSGIEIPMLLPPYNRAGFTRTGGPRGKIGSAVTVAPLFDPANPTTAIDARPVSPPLRASDLINTLAIGPSHDPLRSRTAGGTVEAPENEDIQWTTLGEAMALALDLDSPAQPIGGSSDPVDPMYRIGAVDPRWFNPDATVTNLAGLVHGALVKGRLALDRFVPFVDSGTAGGAADGIYNPEEDRVRGLGLPLALGILDRFRVGATGSLTAKVAGTVNINTAPQPVLWTLPMAAPTTQVGDWPTATTVPSNRLLNPDNEFWDVTGTLLAYRDKDRGQSWRVPFARTTLVNERVVSRFDDAEELFEGLEYPPPTYDATRPRTWAGRYNGHGILAAREAPGFASPAELLAARLRFLPADVSDHLLKNEDRRQVSVDRQARAGVRPRDLRKPASFPGDRTWIDGVGGALYSSDITANQSPFARSELPDAPSASQAIADALLGTVNTRSDVFCAWFLVHGYTEADVTGLAPTDPMVPSLARRYVMVVDRSNVVGNDDRPRILLFQEVPIR